MVTGRVYTDSCGAYLTFRGRLVTQGGYLLNSGLAWCMAVLQVVGSFNVLQAFIALDVCDVPWEVQACLLLLRERHVRHLPYAGK